MSVPNPTSFWKLSNTTDDLGANNLTNTGTVTFSAGKIGNAADFDTTNKRLSVSNSVGMTGSGTNNTWGFWVKPNTQVGYVLDIADSGYARRLIVYWDTGSTITLWVGGNTRTSTATFSNGTWYYIRITKSGSTFELFVNESSQGTVSMGTATSTANFFSIGAAGDSFGANTNCQIDAFGVWASTLNTTQGAFLYNGGTGREYPFPSSNPGMFQFF